MYDTQELEHVSHSENPNAEVSFSTGMKYADVRHPYGGLVHV